MQSNWWLQESCRRAKVHVSQISTMHNVEMCVLHVECLIWLPVGRRMEGKAHCGLNTPGQLDICRSINAIVKQPSPNDKRPKSLKYKSSFKQCKHLWNTVVLILLWNQTGISSKLGRGNPSTGFNLVDLLSLVGDRKMVAEIMTEGKPTVALSSSGCLCRQKGSETAQLAAFLQICHGKISAKCLSSHLL